MTEFYFNGKKGVSMRMLCLVLTVGLLTGCAKDGETLYPQCDKKHVEGSKEHNECVLMSKIRIRT